MAKKDTEEKKIETKVAKSTKTAKVNKATKKETPKKESSKKTVVKEEPKKIVKKSTTVKKEIKEVPKKEVVIKKEVKEEVKPVVTPKVEDTVKVSNEVIKDALKKVTKDAKRQARREILTKIFEELIAFIVLVIIICLCVGGAYYWYTNYYKDKSFSLTGTQKSEEKNTSSSDYKIVSYTSDNENISFLNDNFIIEYNKNNSKLLKIVNRDLEVLFEGEAEISNVIVDKNNNIYGYNDEDAESENLITLYKLEDDEFVLVKEFNGTGYYFSPIIYKDNYGYDYVLGFYGEENSDKSKSIIYDLEGKKYEHENLLFVGDYLKNSSDAKVITRNKNYIVVQNIVNKKYGLYSISEDALVYDAEFDVVHCTYEEDQFIVGRNGSVGILTANTKKLVDYEYDFIDVNDGFYVVSKDNKLGIMNSDLKMVTDLSFDFQITNSMRNYSYVKDNTFKVIKINDMYLLITNNNDGINTYTKHVAYLIKNDGTYTEINETDIKYDIDANFMYSYDNNTGLYTIYVFNGDGSIDDYNINLNKYELKNIDIKKYNSDIVMVNDEIYINFKDDKEVEITENYEKYYKFDTFKIKIDSKDKKATIYDNEELLSTYTIGSKDDYVVRGDKTFYILIGKTYYSMEKIS